jgi:cytochrome c
MRGAAVFGGAVLLCFTGCGTDPEPEEAAPRQPAAMAPVKVTAAMGMAVFRRCTACHTIAPSGAHGIGPNLHGVVGRAVGRAAGFAYSPALSAHGGVWDEATLDAYLANPRQAIPGNRMTFAGISEPAERQALILYLAQQK